MANITPRRNKNGEIIAYQIRVFRGRTADGSRLKDYMMTWRPDPGMTPRQMDREVKRQAALFETACKEGRVAIERPTFESYSAYVLDLKEHNGAKDKTLSAYKNALKLINTEIGPLKLQDLRPEHLNRLYKKLAEPGQNLHTGGGLSPKTVLGCHKVVSTILTQAVKEGLIISNVAQRATPPKLPKHEMETLEVEDVQNILQALKTEPLEWQVCIQLLIATGARRGEIMGLRWERIDWDNNRLDICENRVYTPERGANSTTPKAGEARCVSVSPSVMMLLKQWRAEQAATFLKLGITPSGYVMTAKDGSPMHPDSPTRWLAKFSKRHNLPPLHPHLFRHTQASLLISQGVDILTVSKRLGHTKVSTTMDVYSHALAKSDEKASEALDALIFKKKA